MRLFNPFYKWVPCLLAISSMPSNILNSAQNNSSIYIGGYIYGQGAAGNQVNFETCLNAGVNFVDFCQYSIMTTGHLDDNTAPSIRLPDFLNGLANNPDFIANIVLSSDQTSTNLLIETPSNQINFFNDLQTIVMPNIGNGKFAGLTLDFETPLLIDKDATTTLLTQIKAMLSQVGGTLTVVTSAIDNDSTGIDIKTLWENQIVDYFEPMMYSNISSHGQPQASYFFTLEGMQLSINEFTSNGVPLDHIVPLLPFYCDRWENIPPGDTFGLEQYGTYNGTDMTIEEIFNLLSQNPEYLHITPPGQGSPASASWVYVPNSDNLGIFFDFMHPVVLIQMMNAIRSVPTLPTITRFGFYTLNEDLPNLSTTQSIINYFPTKTAP